MSVFYNLGNKKFEQSLEGMPRLEVDLPYELPIEFTAEIKTNDGVVRASINGAILANHTIYVGWLQRHGDRTRQGYPSQLIAFLFNYNIIVESINKESNT